MSEKDDNKIFNITLALISGTFIQLPGICLGIFGIVQTIKNSQQRPKTKLKNILRKVIKYSANLMLDHYKKQFKNI